MTTFEGEVYIRPLSRGVCLGEDMIDFEDWILDALKLDYPSAGGTTVRVRLSIELLPPAPQRRPEDGGDD